MPDKEIMLQIKAREESRPWVALDALTEDPRTVPGLIAAFAALAENWRTTADLYEKAKLKGAQTAHVIPLRHAAQQLDRVIETLNQPRRAPLGELQPHGATVNAGLDEPVHRFVPGAGGMCDATVTRDGAEEECNRYASHPAHRLQSGPAPEETIASLDALIAETTAAAAHAKLDAEGVPDFRGPGDLADPNVERAVPSTLVEATRDEIAAIHAANPIARIAESLPGRMDDARREERRAAERAGFPGQASSEEVTAYLRGDADDIPGPPLAPNGITDLTADAETLARLGRAFDDAPPPAVHRAAREILESNPVTMPSIPPVPLLGQPGNAGPAYDHSYIPPGGVPATYTELLTPVPRAALPAHLSHSQIGTAGECGVKYRLQRIGRTPDRDGGADWPETLHEIPQWANIGGNAFHAVIEDIERGVLATSPEVLNAAPPETLWEQHFGAEIARIENTSPVPRSRWRAARKGAEGEPWWWTNGPLMIERYLKARPAEPTAMLDGPAIELERTVPVDTPYGPIDYRAIIDRMTVRTDPAGATTLVIRDYKSSYQMPDSTQQLGEYGQVLRLLGVPAQVRITGTYFNARKGEWTPEADLEGDGWSAEWFRYHVATGHAERLKLTSGPTPARPSSFCGGCPVRWACPLKNGAKS